MPSDWEIYNKEMSQLNHGHALWEPAPLSYFERVQPGDVGYIRTGCFHLLFSAGCPLGKRKLGVEVPSTFEQLEVGPVINRQPRLPGYLSTSNVRATRVRLTPPVLPLSASQPSTSQPSASPVPTLESVSFRLAGGRGAALVTRCLTYREDIQRAGTFERYAKEHYASWVAFARETGHGNDINPVLVTGVDRTKDFAMMSYSNDDDDLRSEFTAPVSGVASASVWGTWHTTGFIHTNCGPQLCCPPSTPTTDFTSPGNNNTETISDWYTQCVFVRYYTVRKRLGVPKVIKAGAGPHDPGWGDREDEESPEVEVRSDPGSDVVFSLCDDDGDNNRSSVTSIESEPDIFIHNTTPDERDDFDVIADYVFQNSDADSVLIHHQDIALLREGGSGLSAQILEEQPPIAVDENGVATIGGHTDPSANTRSNDPFSITPSTPPLIPCETEHEETNGLELPEPRPPSQPVYPSLDVRSCEREAATGAGGSIFKSIPPAHDDPTVGRSTLACESEEEEGIVVPPSSLVARSSAEENEVTQSVAPCILSDATASPGLLDPRRSLSNNPQTSSPALNPHSQPTPDETRTPETAFERFRSSLKQSIRAVTGAGSDKRSTSSVSADANGPSTTSTTTSKEKEKKNVVITEESAKAKTKVPPKVTFEPMARGDTSPSSATGKHRARNQPEQWPAREPKSASYLTSLLRLASFSSPALHPHPQVPSDEIHTPEVASSTSNVVVSPQRTRSISPKPQPSSIGGLSALAPHRSSEETTKGSKNASKPKLTLIQTHTAMRQWDSVDTPRRWHRIEVPELPSLSRRLRNIRGSASMNYLPLSPSPIRERSPISRHDPITPSTCGKVRRLSLDLPNSRRASVEGGRSALSTPRPSSPPFQIQHRGVAPNPPSRTASPTPPARGDCMYDRNVNPPTASLSPSVPENLSNTGDPHSNTNSEHHDLLREATSILCRELLNPPESNTTGLGVVELEESELRLRALARLERVSGKNDGADANGVSNTPGSTMSGFDGLGAGSASSVGEDRERRLFSEALKDGYVLCQLMNKVRPGSIARVDKGEDGVVRTSNITKFLASCYSTLELSRGDLFHCDDLIEGSFESLARVSRTIIALVEGSENPPPRSPLRPELEVLDGPVSFPRTVSGSVVNLGVATNTASTSELLNRSASEDNMVRLTLIVNEEGKPVMQFRLGNCIGRGQFGAVYRALNLDTGQMVAVKRIRLTGLKEEEISRLVKEVDLVKRLSHPSIVKYEGMAKDEHTLSIVLEYVENGSLGQTLKAFGPLNERLVASYVVKILEGLHYLHQSDVVHCDLKAANILTTKDGNVKLSDFGVSLNLRAMEREMKEIAGSPNWMAPEVIELKGASPKSDIWSLGCTVIELLTGRPPYADIANAMSVMFRITEDEPPIPETVSPLLDDFLRQCFQRDPAKRPDAGTLCEHEWLKENRVLQKELRPQDSISSFCDNRDYTRRSVWRLSSSSSDSAESEALAYDETPRIEEPPPPTPARPTSQDNDGPAVREHSFVRTTFNKSVICRVCTLPVKRSAVLCDQCSLVTHSRCARNAPPTCDLRAQLLSYARSAEKGLSPLEAPGPTTTSPSTEWVSMSGTSPDFGRRSTPGPATPPVYLPTASGSLATFKRSRSLPPGPAAQPTLPVNPKPTPRERRISFLPVNPPKWKGKEVAKSLPSSTSRSVGARSESIVSGGYVTEVGRLSRTAGPSLISVGPEHRHEGVSPTEVSGGLPSSSATVKKRTSKNDGCLVQ